MTRFKIAVLVATLILSIGMTATAEETVIRLTVSAGGSGKAFAGGVALFNEAYKGKYRVEVDTIAFESLLDRSMTQFVARNAFYDVLGVNSAWQNRVWRYLEPLNSFIEEHQVDTEGLYGAIIDSMIHQGNVVGLPVRVGTDVLMYRKDLLAEAGLKAPTNLEELLTVARKLTVGPRDNRELYGFSITAQSPYWTTSILSDFLFMHGVYFLDEEGKPNPALKGPMTEYVLQTMKTLWDERLIPNPFEWTYDDNIVAVQQGKVAMTYEDYMRAALFERPDISKVVGKMGYAVMPMSNDGPAKPRARGGYWILSIDRNSKNKEAAFEFIKFMTGQQAQEHMAFEWANGPSVLSVLAHEEFAKANPAAKAAQMNLSLVGIRDPIPVAERPVIEKAVHDEIHLLLLGQKSPKQAGEAIFNKIQDILK